MCVSGPHKASIEPVTVYAMITRKALIIKGTKVQNAAHSLIEHYTTQQSLHLLTNIHHGTYEKHFY